jgi:signal transduction histidine kinase
MITDHREKASDEQSQQPGLAHRAESKPLLIVRDAVRRMLAEQDLQTNLAEAIRALEALGWRDVAVSLLNDAGGVGTQMRSGELVLSAADLPILPGRLWEKYQQGALEPYRAGGVYVVARDDDADEAGAIFAPLTAGPGPLAGLIWVDGWAQDTAPTGEVVAALDTLAAQTSCRIEHAHLLRRTSQSAEELAEQVEELSMIHRVDRELSAHLNLERVMHLTMDWALRRTGADTGLLLLMNEARTGLVPYVVMGHVDRAVFPYDRHNPLPLAEAGIGRAGRTGTTQYVPDALQDAHRITFIPGARAYVAVPLLMRGEVLGVITVASVSGSAFDEDMVAFLERLGRRAAVALDNARLYRQTEQLASNMAALYNASRAITSTLDRDEVLRRIAQAMGETLECSSAIIFENKPEAQAVQVQAVYRGGPGPEAGESLPGLKQTYSLAAYPAFQTVVEQQHALVLRVADPAVADGDRAYLAADRIRAMLLVPLVAQDELIGVAAVIEGRRDRVFTADEVYKAEALAGQAAIALRQSMLFCEAQELERLKSEMIRMASHDLRNPLNNLIGYTQLLEMSLEEAGMTSAQQMYLRYMNSSSETMRVLLEDLLTLERIESERAREWRPFDLSSLVAEVVESQLAGAAFKGQTLTLEGSPGLPPILGSLAQLRQAVANLIGNAIKYTPEGGHIAVTVRREEGGVAVSVADDGYGISPARQERIFERFYRAREPGTEHVAGTGLGLSLVKTVIERHGGRVWFSSVPGEGSTFGLWVPAAIRL